MSTRLVAAMIAILGAGTGAIAAEADDPYAKEKAVYYSKEVLGGALAVIAQMQEPELRVFTNYLAECDDEGSSEVAKHACNAAKEEYEIEFGTYAPGHTRPLDDLINARDMLFILRLPIYADKLPCSPYGAGMSNTEAYVNCKRETVRVISALDHAVHDRFQSLKALQK